MRWLYLILSCLYALSGSYLYPVVKNISQAQSAKTKKALLALESHVRQALYYPKNIQLDDLETSLIGYTTLMSVLTKIEQEQLEDLIQMLQGAVNRLNSGLGSRAEVGTSYSKVAAFIKKQLQQLGAISKTRTRTQSRAAQHNVAVNYYAQKPDGQSLLEQSTLVAQSSKPVSSRPPKVAPVSKEPTVNLDLLEKRLRTVLQDPNSSKKQFYKNFSNWISQRVSDPLGLATWVQRNPVEGAIVIGGLYLFEQRGYNWHPKAAQFMEIVREKNLMQNIVEPAAKQIKKSDSRWNRFKKWFKG